jgi:hypothetical protein
VATPVADHVVQPAAASVRPLVDAVAATVVAPVAEATQPLSPVLGPVSSEVVAPAATHVPAFVRDLVGPLVDPVAGTLGPALRPLAGPVGGVLGPVLGAVDGTPVGGLLDPLLGVVGAVPPTGPTVLGPLPTSLVGPVLGADAAWWSTARDHGAPGAPGTPATGVDSPAATSASVDPAATGDDQGSGAFPAGGDSRPGAPAPSAPAPTGSGGSGTPLRSPATPDVLAVLTAAALVLGGSRLLAVARGRVELPLRLREVPVFPA